MDETLETYAQGAEEYRELTGYHLDDDLKAWLASAVEGLPLDAVIFEIGSAHGRDALYLRDVYSLNVNCSDAVPEFVSMLEDLGLPAERWDVERDVLPEHVGLYIANAVLLHFSDAQVKGLLRDAYLKLPFEGKFAFTLKKGSGSETLFSKLPGPRFFNYWLADEVKGVVKDAGFEVLEIVETDVWLNCVAIKRRLLVAL